MVIEAGGGECECGGWTTTSASSGTFSSTNYNSINALLFSWPRTGLHDCWSCECDHLCYLFSTVVFASCFVSSKTRSTVTDRQYCLTCSMFHRLSLSRNWTTHVPCGWITYRKIINNHLNTCGYISAVAYVREKWLFNIKQFTLFMTFCYRSLLELLNTFHFWMATLTFFFLHENVKI